MRKIRNFGVETAGVVALEFALLLPVIFGVMFFGADMVALMQRESRLHRSTAMLADALASQHLDKGVTLSDVIMGDMAGAQLMFRDMMGPEGNIGITVTYLDSTTMYSDEPVLMSQSIGIPCVSPAPVLINLSKTGLITAANTAQAELVMVQCTYAMPREWSLSTYVFPDTFSSYFITVRKQWRR